MIMFWVQRQVKANTSDDPTTDILVPAGELYADNEVNLMCKNLRF